MHFKPHILILFAILCLAATCERDVDLDIDIPPPKIVVISNFTNDQLIEVAVSQSKSVLIEEPSQPLENAIVEVFEVTNFQESLEFVPKTNELLPFYRSVNFQPKVETLYTLKVEAPGFDPVIAESSIPRPVNINDAYIQDTEVTISTEEEIQTTSFQMTMNFLDPLGEGNYYHLNFIQEIHSYHLSEGDTIISKSDYEKVNFDRTSDSNFFIAYFDGGVLFRDAEFNGKAIAYSFPYSVYINTQKELLGKFIVELRTVSKDYFLYHNSLSRQVGAQEVPFAEPVSVYNNIENGLGIFAGYSISTDSISLF